MYEDKTDENIKKEMLDNISDEVDKTENKFINNAITPAAIKFAETYIELDYVANKLDVENLFGEELERFVYQRTGIERKPATKATTTVIITGQEGVKISKGELVGADTVNFVSMEDKNIGPTGQMTVLVECELAGTIGNVPAGAIKYFPVSIAGLTSVTNPESITNGYDAESDESLLERYYERIRTPATSGNIYHYRNWAKEVVGVGDVRIISRWRESQLVTIIEGILDTILQNQNYTSEEVKNIIDTAMRYALEVKVIIIDSNKQPASEELVAQVQEYIDPGSRGLGEGQAPIGAFCTVVSATGKAIDITFKVTRDTNYTVEQIKANVENNIKEYLQSIAFKEYTVSYAKVGAIILDSEGVLDHQNLIINLGTANIAIADEEVAILGEVVVNE